MLSRFTAALAATALACATAALAAGSVEPQFGGQCTMSLAEGQSVATDCGVDWIAADGKRYCFGSAARCCDAGRRYRYDTLYGNLANLFDAG